MTFSWTQLSASKAHGHETGRQQLGPHGSPSPEREAEVAALYHRQTAQGATDGEEGWEGGATPELEDDLQIHSLPKTVGVAPSLGHAEESIVCAFAGWGVTSQHCAWSLRPAHVTLHTEPLGHLTFLQGRACWSTVAAVPAPA